MLRIICLVPLALLLTNQLYAQSNMNHEIKDMQLFQTTREGDRLRQIDTDTLVREEIDRALTLNPNETHQTLIGIGSSFTESSAHALSELSTKERNRVLEAYFSPNGAHISLTRTHIASCDFSLKNYTYAPVANDTELTYFSIEPDYNYLLPLIKDAQSIVGAQFHILASPWTAPPWMKDNNTWNGGELLKEHYQTFADYIVKYIQAYAAEDIPIWGITPVNEPFGNNSSWESMHFFDAEKMRELVGDYLGPTLRKANLDVPIWIYDQNREELMLEYAKAIYEDKTAAQYVRGMAVHWYQSTIDVGGEILDEVHQKYPTFEILHSEGCIDNIGNTEEIGSWLEDDWYWRAEATDWGYTWAENKANHPKYRPFFRYTRDLIGGLNHHFTGWIDWNMVLNTRGGPNHVNNFCLAPVLVDSGKDQAYLTPLYYSIAHCSKFIRPGATRIGLKGHDEKEFMATAFKNPDDSIAVIVFNLTEEEISYSISLGDAQETLSIAAGALQTILLP